VGLSKDVILRRWVNSQPKNAKWEVVAIIDILGRINLDDALALHLRNYVPPFYLDEWNGREFSAFQDFQKEFVQDAINHFLEPYPQSIIEIIQGLTALSPKERMPLKTAIEKWEQCEQSD
jgi:hypothetical protein